MEKRRTEQLKEKLLAVVRLLDEQVSPAIREDLTALAGELVQAGLQQEAALKKRVAEVENGLKVIYSHLPVVSWEAQFCKGRLSVLQLSPNFSQLTGFDPEEAQNNPAALAKFIHPDDREKLALLTRDDLASQPGWKIEFRLLLPGASVRWFWLAGVSEATDQEGELRISGILFDLTRRRQFEQELQEKNEEIASQYEELNAQNEELAQMNEELRQMNEELAQTNAELAVSETKYRLMFANHPQPMWIYDLETLAFLEVNDAAVNHYGYSREEFLQMTLREIRPAGEVPLLLEEVVRTRQGYSPSGEWRHLKRNGQEIMVEIFSQPVRFGERRARHVMVVDVTERKKTGEKLREAYEILEETGEIAKVGGWEFDAVTGEGSWTPEVARIHDLDPRDTTNVAIGLGYYTEASRQLIEKAIEEAIHSGRIYDLELEMITGAGNRKWVRTIGRPVFDGGKVVKVRGSFQDVTDRKMVEAELLRHREKLQLLVKERTTELEEKNELLERMNTLFVGREFRIKELKLKITDLENRLNLKTNEN